MSLKHPFINVLFYSFVILFTIEMWLFNTSFYWILWLFFAYVVFILYASFHIRSQYFVKTINHGNTSERQIAITFDDGPHPKITSQVLELLEEYNVKGTFFCIGKNIEENKGLVQKMDAAGHLIANHTYHHSNQFGFYSYDKVSQELLETAQLIEATIHKKPLWFRPPFGVTNPRIGKATRDLGYDVIGWNVRSLDTVIRNEKILSKRVLNGIKPGCIVLFHDIYPRLLPVLRILLEYAKENNYNIVPLNELINKSPYE